MKPKITEAKVSDLVFDDKNFNKGNPFGESLIEKSFQRHGAARSILIDKNNRIIAGNKSTQKFAEGGNEKVIIVEVTGDTLVAVKRTDIDLDTKQGRELALADNMTSSKNFVLDVEIMEAVCEEFLIEAVEWGVEKYNPENKEKEIDENLETEHKCPSCGYVY